MTDAGGAGARGGSSNIPGGVDPYELRQIVSVATSYLESGMLEDAEDLLQEIIESGTQDPEITALALKINDARGGLTDVVTPAERPAARRVLQYFTTPLPGAEQLPRDVQRHLTEGERDYAAGRLHSAHDATLLALSKAPKYLPLYVRLAELSIALGDEHGADRLASQIAAGRAYFDQDITSQLASLQAALHPEDIDALVSNAWLLLGRRDATLEPFVPAAIEATLSQDAQESRRLARAYVELRPNAQDAVQSYLRAVLTSGELAEIIDAFQSHVGAGTARPDDLYTRMMVAVVERDPEWLRWLELTVVAIAARPSSWSEIESTARLTSDFMPEDRRDLAMAAIASSAGRWSVALEWLDKWALSSSYVEVPPAERFIASYSRARASEELNRPDAGNALAVSVHAALDAETQLFLANTRMFGRPAALQSVLDEYVSFAVAQDNTGAFIDRLQELRDERPDVLELRVCLADLLIKSRRLNDGVHELRDVAQQYERRGDFVRMVAAMRRISEAVPTNIEIKAMLVDVYLRRGILDEALIELQALSDLYRRSSMHDDAVRCLTRAAEIAYATSNLTLGQDLFNQATEIDPDDVPVRHAAVAFFLQTGAVQPAIDQLRQVARIALAQRDPDEAVAALHQIIGLSPQDTDAYHRLGEVLTTMGQYGQAERVYRRLATLAPGDPVLQAKQSALAVLAATQ
jgi:tetratricopeptide (TPR) repeat protein